MSDKEFRTATPMFDELRGEKVIVRPYRLEDAQALYDAINESRDHIRPWLPFADFHQTPAESRDWIAHTVSDWVLRQNFNLSIWDAAPDHFLGGIGLHPRNWDNRYFEIGYWLRLNAPGHGLMSEAVSLLVNFALTELNATRLEIRCDERNDKSAAVAKRQGFSLDGRLRNDMRATDGTLRNTLIYSLLPEDRA